MFKKKTYCKSIKRFIARIKGRFRNNLVKDFVSVEKYFKDKSGMEIGGPSPAFKAKGYIPVYKIMNMLDDVNFSNYTIWTNEAKKNKGCIVEEKIGKMYIADATNLASIKDNVYDFILSSNNIEHIANPMKAIEQWILKLKQGGVLVIVAPRKEVTFDHKREIVKFEHLLEDYNSNIDEHDLTHLKEILELHDLSMNPQTETFEKFKERCLKNYENRCLHHHVFDSKVLEEMCKYFSLLPILTEKKQNDHIIIAKKL